MSNTNIRNISLKLRLYPTKEQESYFNKTFGCSRFIYNYYLSERNDFYNNHIKGIEDKEQRKEIYKTFKETPLRELKEKYPWLMAVESQTICQSYLNVQKSFDNFFKGLSKHPRFHSKRGKNIFKSCMPSQTLLDWNNHTVKIPKIGKVLFRNAKAPKMVQEQD